MREPFRFNDVLTDAVEKGNRDLANEVERRLETWLDYPTFVSVGLDAGTAAAPSIFFNADADTGFFGSGAAIGFAGGGTQGGAFNSQGFLGLGASSKAAPAFTFISDLDTGLFLQAADSVSITAGGVEFARFDETNGLVTLNVEEGETVIGDSTTPAADTRLTVYRDANGFTLNVHNHYDTGADGIRVILGETGQTLDQSDRVLVVQDYDGNFIGGIRVNVDGDGIEIY